MRIAIPSDAPGGLNAAISAHFGHCDVFTLVDVEGADISGVELLPNPGHEHGGCLGPVNLLHQHGARSMIAGGMGPRPLAGFQQAGIEVFFREDSSTVQEAVTRWIAGELRPFGPAHTCGGSGGGCGSHEHAEPEFEPVDQAVGQGLQVRFSYELLEDGQAEPIESTEARCVHGSGQILPALESALEGRRAGDVLDLVLSARDAFGERNDRAVIELDAHMLPEEAVAGDLLQMQTQSGQLVPMRLLSRSADKAVLDANHPLAGKAMRFKIKVLEVARQRT